MAKRVLRSVQRMEVMKRRIVCLQKALFIPEGHNWIEGNTERYDNFTRELLTPIPILNLRLWAPPTTSDGPPRLCCTANFFETG